MLIDYIPGKKKKRIDKHEQLDIVVPFTEVGKVEGRAALKKKFKSLGSDIYT